MVDGVLVDEDAVGRVSGGRLQDRVALICGAGQTPGETIGNGRATALRFAEEGAQVFLVDRDIDRAQDTLAAVRARTGADRCAAWGADVSMESDVERMIAACIARFGHIDILHNNVGIGAGDSGCTSMTEEVWERLLRVNLRSVMFTCKHVLPGMRVRRSGCIINISSVAAVCSVGIVGYKTSKAAVNAYTQSLAIGNARYNIRANVIMPGLMNTPMAIEGYVAAGHDREELIRSRDAMVPLGGRMGDAWDVANAALFLASDEAKFITGINLPVDGGQSARIG